MGGKKDENVSNFNAERCGIRTGKVFRYFQNVNDKPLDEVLAQGLPHYQKLNNMIQLPWRAWTYQQHAESPLQQHQQGPTCGSNQLKTHDQGLKHTL